MARGNGGLVPEESVIDKGIFRDQHLPEVVVKAKYRRDKPLSSEKFYGVNYVDRNKIEEHNYMTLMDILRAMPGVVVEADDDLKAEKRFSLRPTRGNSTLKGSSFVLLVDGVRQDYDIESVLEMPSFDIESVQLLRPWEALAYVSFALDGAISVKTRFGSKKMSVVSKGTYYTPMGLSEATSTRSSSGTKPDAKSRMLVDIVDGKDIWSFECPVK